MRKALPFFLILCLIISACGAKETPAPSVQETVTITDSLGRSVTVPANPRRTAVLIGSFAHVWQLAGGSVAAAADDAWTQFDLNLDPSVVNLGKTTAINLELLLSAEPDFIIASTNTQAGMELMPVFNEAGIPAAYFDVNDFDEYLSMLSVCTDITGRKDLYQKNGLDVKTRVDAVIAQAAERNDAPQVLYLRATASSVKVKGGSGTVLGSMLTDLGCVNIADVNGSLLEDLSIERIIEADPEYIFIVMQGSDSAAVQERLTAELTGNPAWGGLAAVKENRLYFMDQKLYNLKPNDRWGEAYEGLARILFG